MTKKKSCGNRRQGKPEQSAGGGNDRAGIEDLAINASGLAPDRVVVYKKTAVRQLNLHVFEPAGLKPSDKRPAIVFFHGGAWRMGDPKQFYTQCSHLAGHGMVALSAEYRLTPEGVCVSDCVSDAKSAVRWIRRHAAEFGVDPNRIAAGGGSAGGHLAVTTALVPGLDDPAEDLTVSSRTNLLVLYNPALFHERGEQTLTPQMVTGDTPPTILMYGTDDAMIEYGKLYLEISRKKGFHAELHAAKNAGHGFFNKLPWRESTTHLIHEFLAGQGYVASAAKGQPPQEYRLTPIVAEPMKE